jgi:hypothetical protein
MRALHELVSSTALQMHRRRPAGASIRELFTDDMERAPRFAAESNALIRRCRRAAASSTRGTE